MKNSKCLRLCLTALCIFLLSQFLRSDSQYKYTLATDMDFYFAHISYTEVRKDGNDPLVFREGSLKPELAVLNLPLGPGDTIQTTDKRECEIQFDTGTLVRMDMNTLLKIETVLAESLSSGKKLTNLVLLNGKIYVMYKRYKRGEVFQIITPNAAIKLDQHSVGFVNAKDDGSTDIQIKEGKGHVMFGPDEKHLEKKKLKKHMTLTVSSDDTIAPSAYERDMDFELWNESMNEDFVAMHKGVTFIPDPIYKYPEAVVYFAQKYSNMYGEWVWNSLYGFVWKPNYSRKYPGGDWQPYVYGNWSAFDNQLFWVPAEPWGWVPYHLGVWLWDKDVGWMWLPGDAFAPAWVTWEFFAGFYMWKPWSLYDWYYNPFSYSRYNYYGDPWAFYPSDGSTIPPDRNKETLKTIRKDQLKDKKKAGIPSKPPKTITRTYSNFVNALEQNDGRIFAALEDIPNQIVVVKSKYLNADRIQEKRMRITEVPFQQLQDMGYVGQDIDPYRSAFTTFHQNEVIASFGEGFFSGQPTLEGHVFRNQDTFSSPSISKSTTEKGIPKEQSFVKETVDKSNTIASVIDAARMGFIIADSVHRFRDWNPDMAYARQNGVTIRYSSRTNEVHCPDLGISSRGIVATSSRKISAVSFDSGSSSTKPSFSTSWTSSGSSGSDSSPQSSSSSSKVSGVSSGEKKKN
ncbi:MAG TPA: DUF6600 domain-containing protein [Candidatus Heimdallarchaeota archaeon]|nr:DUF6600 domain-containing protein [Candidatus Heimdallarchaeota archaeon]